MGVGVGAVEEMVILSWEVGAAKISSTVVAAVTLESVVEEREVKTNLMGLVPAGAVDLTWKVKVATSTVEPLVE